MSSLIIGATKVARFEDNLNASAVMLTPDEMQRLNDLSQLAPEYPGWLIKLSSQGLQGQAAIS